jgi:hypothetical protein
MAVFQLGAIVTGIVGSIGGTTFKRQGSSLVMQKKSNGASRNSVLQNIRLGKNALIFRSWNLLSIADKLAWSNIAASTAVKNKFGENVFISGVSFQRKCQLQIAPFSADQINQDNFNTNLASITVGFCGTVLSNPDFIFLATTSENFVSICFALEFSLNNLNAPDYNVTGLFSTAPYENGVPLDLYPDMIAKYPFITNDYNLRLYYWAVNSSGWRSPTFMTEVEKG